MGQVRLLLQGGSKLGSRTHSVVPDNEASNFESETLSGHVLTFASATTFDEGCLGITSLDRSRSFNTDVFFLFFFLDSKCAGVGGCIASLSNPRTEVIC